MQELETYRNEWRLLTSEVQECLKAFDDPVTQDPGLLSADSDKIASLYCKLGELDAYFRLLLNSYHMTQRDRDAAENSSKLFGNFFAEAPIGYVVLDENGLIEDANAVASEYWSINRHRMKGLGLFGLIAGECIGVLSRAIEAAKISNQRRTLDIKCVRPKGQSFWGRFDIIQTKESNSIKKRLLCSIVDITADRLLEDAIKKTAVGLSSSTGGTFFKQLTNFLTGYDFIDIAMISIVDSDKRFVPIAVSPSTFSANLDGYTYDVDLNDRKFRNIFFEPNSVNIDKLARVFDAKDGISVFLFDDNRTISGELAILSRNDFDNKKLYSSILKVVSARASAELQRFKAEEELKAYRDRLEVLVDQRTSELQKNNIKLAKEIEKRKKIESNLRHAKNEAELAAKAKSTFLANMSHEIRTPMNGILGVASLLETTASRDKWLKYVKVIQESGGNLLHIINDILDLSKLESGRIELDRTPFDLRELFVSLCEVYWQKARDRGLIFFLDYPGDEPSRFYGDRVRIRQVLENLISNALKFTSRGSVLIRVRCEQGSRLKVSVYDTGIGLTPSQRQLVFERFSQADSSTTRRYGGTGLGLSICKKIVELMGGIIDCESEKHVGSCFWFQIPIEVDDKGALQVTPVSLLEPCVFWIMLEESHAGAMIGEALKAYGCLVHFGEQDPSVLSKYLYVVTDDRFDCEDPKEQLNARFSSLRSKTSVMLLPLLGRGGSSLDGLKPEPPDSPESQHSVGRLQPERPYSATGILEVLPWFSGSQEADDLTQHEVRKVFLSRKILLAEDNPINRLVAVDLLESMGATVDIAEDGEEAVKLYSKSKYDLVLMDCLMPNVDGFEALRMISAMDPKRPPVVAVTANAMKGDREKCIRAGFDDYLSKPISVSELMKIHELL